VSAAPFGRAFPGDYFMAPDVPQYGSTNFGLPVYDPKLKEIFFSNPAMGEVEAYSTEDGHRVGSVTVPGPLGLSLSPDNALLAVGTSTPFVYFVDPSALHITGQVEVPPSYLSLPGGGPQAVMPYLMANGIMLTAMAYWSGNGSGNLVSYDPVTNTFAQANPPSSTAGGGISGPLPARSLDGKYLIVPTYGQQLALYSADAQGYVNSGPGSNFMELIANPDGTQFATNYGGTITVFNRDLKQQYQYKAASSSGWSGLVFSRDGKYLYIRDYLDIAALNSQTGTLAGYKGFSIASTNQGIVSDVDESYRVIGANDQGAFVMSAANLQPKIPLQLYVEGSGLVSPNGGPPAGGTKVQSCLSNGGYQAASVDSSEEAYFGASPATKDLVVGGCITATTPAASTTGPVTVLLTDAKNNAVLLPNGYSYVPHVRWISPNALPPTVFGPVVVDADGILDYRTNLRTVAVGGQLAGIDPEYRTGLLLRVHPGSTGWGDLTLTLTDGSADTVKNAVQFLAQDVTVGSGQYTSAVYDSLRDRFYLVGTNNQVMVFDPGTRSLLQPLQSSLVSSKAVLSTVAITPDNSRLVVSDPTDRSVVVFDLAGRTSVVASVLQPSDPLQLWGKMPVVATNRKAFVVLLGYETSGGVREIDLSTMTVQNRTNIPAAGPFGVLPNSGSSSGDGSMILFGQGDTGTPSPGYVWKYDSATDAFSAPIQLLEPQSFLPVLAVNGDGSVLVASSAVLGQDLESVVPFSYGGLENSLTASGALLYTATGDIEIKDVRSGRLILTFPGFPNGDYATALAIDPSGRKMLACGGGSLIYYELGAVPLAAATVTPAQATPGETVTVRGNGFISGTSATIGGVSAACTMEDDSTLQCVVPNVNAGVAPMSLTNPDGQTYSFENALTVQ